LLEQCCGKKTKYKKLEDSIFKEYYDRMHKKLTERKFYSRRMYRLRSSTVEPVLGTLINYMNMRRVNTRGIESANKHVLMAALAYNLKKCLKYIRKDAAVNVISVPVREMGLPFSIIFFLIFGQNVIISENIYFQFLIMKINIECIKVVQQSRL